MQLVAYLNFEGNAREAMDFYAHALGGKVTQRFTYGASPMAEQCGPAAADVDAIAIRDADLDRVVDGRLRARHELLDIRVVGRLTLPDDRMLRTIDRHFVMHAAEQLL